MHARRAATVGLVGIASSFGLAGCGGGGSSSVSAGTYVATICNTIGPYEKDIASRYSQLSPSSIKSAAQGKVVLQGFLSAIAKDTDTALGKLKAAGTPNVPDGGNIQSTIVGAFVRLDGAMQSVAKGADALPTGSPTAFQAAATTLSARVRTSLSGIDASLSGLKSPALEKAAAKEKACTSLGA